MKDIHSTIAFCRRDPEVAALTLQIAACLYGIAALLLAGIPADIDLSPLGRLLFGDLSTTDFEADVIGHRIVDVTVAISGTWAVVMGISGVGVEIAYRLGRMPGRVS